MRRVLLDPTSDDKRWQEWQHPRAQSNRWGGGAPLQNVEMLVERLSEIKGIDVCQSGIVEGSGVNLKVCCGSAPRRRGRLGFIWPMVLC